MPARVARRARTTDTNFRGVIMPNFLPPTQGRMRGEFKVNQNLWGVSILKGRQKVIDSTPSVSPQVPNPQV